MPSKIEQANIISSNIIRLRDGLKWNQAKLAQEAGISAAALSKIEQGESRIPTIVVLRKLASALKVQLHEITGEEPEENSELDVRNKEFYRQWDVLDKLSEEDQKILKGMAERLRNITQKMIDEQKGASEAESLIEALGIDTLPIRPHEVVSAIDSDNFRVVMELQNFDSDRILGKAEGNTHGALIYINSNIPDPGRLNFTAAHEIGHVCMHIMLRKKMTFSCGSKELSNPFDDPIEKEANGFASGLLLPRNLIAKLTDNETNWKNISEISTVCQTSLQATFRRMSILDNSPIALIIHKDGQFKGFALSDNFGFFIARTPLSTEQKSLCIEVKEEGYPPDFERMDASDWVNPNLKGNVLESIYSSSINLKDGFVYTLLTYDEDCYLEENEDY